MPVPFVPTICRPGRSTFSHYLPRLRSEFYQADAIVFWTMPIAHRATGWLNPEIHAVFRELLLHTAAREGLLCPAYCLMPDHIHFVWMGLRKRTDQRRAIRFLRVFLGRRLRPIRFQHQAYDHVLSPEERRRSQFTLACTDYVLNNPVRANLATTPAGWPFLGAVAPGYPELAPWTPEFWAWLWNRYAMDLEPGIEQRVLPPREMETKQRRLHGGGYPP